MHKLELIDIGKSFSGKSYDSVVLSNLSLYVDDGEFVSILGPSGSGKSTLFHMIGGILKPDEGRILVDGEEITGSRGHISFMPQSNTLLPWRTVLDNVVLGQEVTGGIDMRKARQEALMWLERVGLSGYEKTYPHVLSGGMQQRVAFLRALLSPQQIMCLDEPFGALDALTRIEMQRWLLGIWEANKRSVLFVTHSIEEALFLSDRIYVLSDKPTRVLEGIRIPFARPRRDDLLHDVHFIALKSHIYERMRRESLQL
jgi:ABC-type nitrate/sulfonate/bicarbonate transport system ATPase subunit